MADNKKILFSGIQPTGRPHIGNYFGAMRQFVELQDEYRSLVCIVDYHALTTLQKADELSSNSYEMMLDFLAIGLDPSKAVLFKQSDVPQVTELNWIFNCITTVPYLERAHAYKDAVAKGREVSVGTFDYPLLMAADILIQGAEVVPVGQDQKQHVEYARDTALKFNRLFGPAFKVPEPLILESVKTVPGIDGQKMSKSYNNTIPLFAEDSEIKRLVMSIVTDSDSDVPKNVYAIHALVKDKAGLDALYSEKKGKYKDLKDALIADLIAFIRPMRAKRSELSGDRAAIMALLKEGGNVAEQRAEAKMVEVRKLVGVDFG